MQSTLKGLTKPGELRDAIEVPGWTDPRSAAERLAAVRIQLRRGADPNDPAEMQGSVTPLMRAAVDGYSEICRLLIEHGADLEEVNNLGWTALMGAVAYGKNEAVRVLLDAGAEIDVESRSKKSAKSIAKDNAKEDAGPAAGRPSILEYICAAETRRKEEEVEEAARKVRRAAGGGSVVAQMTQQRKQALVMDGSLKQGGGEAGGTKPDSRGDDDGGGASRNLSSGVRSRGKLGATTMNASEIKARAAKQSAAIQGKEAARRKKR